MRLVFPSNDIFSLIGRISSPAERWDIIHIVYRYDPSCGYSNACGRVRNDNATHCTKIQTHILVPHTKYTTHQTNDVCANVAQAKDCNLSTPNKTIFLSAIATGRAIGAESRIRYKH